MSVMWFFTPMMHSPYAPAIHGQLEHLSSKVLVLRNPWIPDSVFTGKIYCACTLFILIGLYPPLLSDGVWSDSTLAIFLYVSMLHAPFIFIPFLAHRIWSIKNTSSFYFNRHTQKIYFRHGRELKIFDWSLTAGGILSITERVNGSTAISYGLALAMPRADGSLHKNGCIWIDSNEPTESSIIHVAEVWEYIRQFMAHGPDQLPAPGEPNWWHAPLNAICLTPAQAWRHYAPWRTGEPGEMQGKKLWLLPMWAVLFPYNLSIAVFWYAICRVFNVRAAPAPPEAFERTSNVIDRNDRVENP